MTTTKSLIGRAPRILETAILANLLGSVIIGLLARLVMTALTLGGGRSDQFSPLNFTLLGTIRIVTFPMLFGIPMALLLVALWRYLPGSGWAKAISAGVFTLVFPGLPLLTDSSFNINNVNRYLGRTLFVPLYLCYGFLVGGVINYLNNHNETDTSIASDTWRRWKKILLPALLVMLAILYVWSDSVAFNR